MTAPELLQRFPSLAEHDWRVIPGRKVAHAMVGSEYSMGGVCGFTSRYAADALTIGASHLCELCVLRLVTGVNAAAEKFFCGHVSAATRARRRRSWRQAIATTRIHGQPE